MRRLFVALVCVLTAVGVQMVHSASLTSIPGRRSEMLLFRHVAYLVIGALAGALVSRVPPRIVRERSGMLLIGFCLLLAGVLVPGLGRRVNGAQRWLYLGGFSFQPSELGRLVLPAFAAAAAVRFQSAEQRSMKNFLRILSPLAIVAPLTIVEPDLGATVFLCSSVVLTLFVAGWPLRHFMFVLVPVTAAAGSLLALRPYQLRRITGFLEAWQDIARAPWQIRQSLMSFGAGGFEGTGIGAGWQKLSYLPEAHTDFVFAVIGEELGLAGTLGVIIMWIGVLLTGRAALRHLRKDSFEWLLGTTLVLQIVLQALANVAVVTAMVPPKGVPHPFISYGGTNLVVNMIAVGLVVAMASSRSAVLSDTPAGR